MLLNRLNSCVIALLLTFAYTSSVFAQHENKLIRSGNAMYETGKFKDAEKSYQQARKKNEASTEATFNLGDALYSQQKFDDASGYFSSVAKNSGDKSIRSNAYHNLGNTLLSQKKYEESINAFKEALKLNPKDEDTRYNLAYAKAKLQQQQSNNNKNNDDKKDKNKQDQKDNKEGNNKQKDQQKKDDQNNKDKNQQKQQQDEQEQQPQQANQKMSKEDAERLLNALNNKEKDLHGKQMKIQGAKVQIDKDW